MLWTLVVWAGAPPSSPRTAPLCKETISPVRPPAPARRRVASRGCLKQLRALACNPLPLPGVHTRPVLPQLRLPPVSAAGHTRLHQSATTLHNLFVGVVEVGEGGQGACIGEVDAEADQEAAGGQRRSPVCEVLQGKHHSRFVHDALDLRHRAHTTNPVQRTAARGHLPGARAQQHSVDAQPARSEGRTGAGSIWKERKISTSGSSS